MLHSQIGIFWCLGLVPKAERDRKKERKRRGWERETEREEVRERERDRNKEREIYMCVLVDYYVKMLNIEICVENLRKLFFFQNSMF